MSALGALVRARVQSRLAHRADLVAAVLADALGAAVGLVIVLTVTHRVPVVAGFAADELWVCWGLAEVARGLAGTVARGAMAIPGTYVLGGELETVLLRPAPPLAQIAVAHAHPAALASVGWGALTVVAARGGSLTPFEAAVLVVGGVGGAVLLLGMLLGVASLGFVVPHRGGSVALAWQTTSYAAWPPAFLPLPLAVLVTAVFPVTFAGYVPGAFLVGHALPVWAWAWPAVVVGAGAGGVLAWRAALRRVGSAA